MKTNSKYLIFLFVKIIIIVLILFLFNKYVFKIYIVKSNNYKSINFNPSDFLIYYKLEKDYQNNDVVLYDNKIYRIIGTYGEVINVKNNKIFIDDDSYFNDISYKFSYPYTIKRDEVFLFNNNYDSRSFGCVKKNKLDGKLIFKMQIRNF